jgi:hypothetical protein
MESGKERGRKKRGVSSAVSGNEKGNVVEKIVAMMHGAPGGRLALRLPDHSRAVAGITAF